MFDFSQELANVTLLPFKISSPHDMTSLWKTLDMGGACKSKTLFVTSACAMEIHVQITKSAPYCSARGGASIMVE